MTTPQTQLSNKGRGCPPKYQPDFAEFAYKVCWLFGARNEDLAELFGVVQSTIYKWKLDYPEFSDAIKNGLKEFENDGIESSLVKRAMGGNYKTKTTQFRIYRDENGRPNRERVRETVVSQEVPPDTAACFILLKNRRNFKDRSEQLHLHAAYPIEYIIEANPDDADETKQNQLPDQKRQAIIIPAKESPKAV